MHEGPMNAQQQDPHHYHHHQLTEVFYDVSQCHLMFVFRFLGEWEGKQEKRIYAVRGLGLGDEILAAKIGKKYAKEYITYNILRPLKVSSDFFTLGNKMVYNLI